MAVIVKAVQTRDEHQPDDDRQASQRGDALQRVGEHPGRDDVYHKPGSLLCVAPGDWRVQKRVLEP